MHARFFLAGLLLLPLAAPAQQNRDFSKIEIKATHVGGNVYLLQGSGGNMAASVGANGIALIDDEFAPLATKIAAALKNLGITDQPVRYVINTHYHFDHTGGNLPFAEQGATLIAHDNVRARLRDGVAPGNGGSIRLEAMPADKGALPVITFDHELTAHVNGEAIRALHYPAGHTDGDSVVFFPHANVVHMGDDYVRYGFPFIDVEAGGSVQGMIAACEDVARHLPADVKVIPGHGDLSNLGEMREFITMLKETSGAVAKALEAGKSLDQMKNEKVLEAWRKRYSGDFISSDAFIDTLYASLTRATHTPFRQHN